MKGFNSVKKAVALMAVAAMFSSFASVAEAADGDIQFSPSKMKIVCNDVTQKEDTGSGVSGYITSSKSQENVIGTPVNQYKWPADKYQYANNGVSNNNEWYLNSQCSNTSTSWTLTITLEDVPAGMYDFNQYIPGGSNLSAGSPLAEKNHTDYCDISVTTQADGAEKATEVYKGNHNFCEATLGAFNDITDEPIALEGTVTITYYVAGGKLDKKYDSNGTSNRTLRLDEIQLLKTGNIPVTENAICKEDIPDSDSDGNGASVWDATLRLSDGVTYNSLNVTATDKDGVIKTGTLTGDSPVLTGPGSVYVAIAVNRTSSQLASENPVVVTAE